MTAARSRHRWWLSRQSTGFRVAGSGDLRHRALRLRHAVRQLHRHPAGQRAPAWQIARICWTRPRWSLGLRGPQHQRQQRRSAQRANRRWTRSRLSSARGDKSARRLRLCPSRPWRLPRWSSVLPLQVRQQQRGAAAPRPCRPQHRPAGAAGGAGAGAVAATAKVGARTGQARLDIWAHRPWGAAVATPGRPRAAKMFSTACPARARGTCSCWAQCCPRA